MCVHVAQKNDGCCQTEFASVPEPEEMQIERDSSPCSRTAVMTDAQVEANASSHEEESLRLAVATLESEISQLRRHLHEVSAHSFPWSGSVQRAAAELSSSHQRIMIVLFRSKEKEYA